jgi:hypothetical protein
MVLGTVKSAPVEPVVAPVPVMATVAEEVFEVTVNVAVSAPAAFGENFSLIVQLPDAAKVNGATGQVVESIEKSALPVNATPVIPSVVIVELLASVTVESALVVPTCCEPNATLLGESKIAPAAIPVPLSVIVCGELRALSVKTSEAVRLPSADGLKLTLTTQLLPARTAPQLSVSLKSLALVPLIATDPTISFVLDGFVSVTCSGPDVELRG